MIKVFIPVIKGKVKTSVRGFWYSKDTKRTYYDYLIVRDYSYTFNRRGFSKTTLKRLEALRIKFNQEALFFINNQGIGYIYNQDNVTELVNRIYSEVVNLRQEIKEALRVYGGVTIYKIDNKYFKEIFYNKEA
jgi:hypothetical protein